MAPHHPVSPRAKWRSLPHLTFPSLSGVFVTASPRRSLCWYSRHWLIAAPDQSELSVTTVSIFVIVKNVWFRLCHCATTGSGWQIWASWQNHKVWWVCEQLFWVFQRFGGRCCLCSPAKPQKMVCFSFVLFLGFFRLFFDDKSRLRLTFLHAGKIIKVKKHECRNATRASKIKKLASAWTGSRAERGDSQRCSVRHD